MPSNYLAITKHQPDAGLRVVASTSEDYTPSCALANRSLHFQPSWIAFPYTESEVAEAVRRAVSDKLPIAVRSGAHDYEGFSMNNGGAVIDVSRMDGIDLSKDGSRCVVGPGVRLRQLYHYLYERGKLSLPGGTCGAVGVAGLTLGGGFGNLGRQHGLMCDRLRRVRLVDYRGRVLDSNITKKGDALLWACRGGGAGSFGVVTAFEFRTVSVPKNVTAFSFAWDWNEATIRRLFVAYEAWAVDARREIGATLVLAAKGINKLHLFGQSRLSERVTHRELSRLLREIDSPRVSSVERTSFLSDFETYAGNDITSTSWKMASTFSREPISDEGLSVMIECLSRGPGLSIIEFDALGGAVADIDVRATAFPHRQERLLWQLQSYWNDTNDAGASQDWIQQSFFALEPFTSKASYRNYCDLNVKDWEARYYGPNYRRLQEIKARLDPQNIFSYPQGIQPAPR